MKSEVIMKLFDRQNNIHETPGAVLVTIGVNMVS